MKLSTMLYAAGFLSIGLSAVNFIQGRAASRSEADDKEQQGNFIGHWAPTFFILGKIVEDREKA